MTHLFGLSVFCAIFGGMWWATARRWRYLAKSYAADGHAHGQSGSPHDKRHMQTLILIGLGGFNSLKGIVTMEAHSSGLLLRIMPPFSFCHKPLFIPYSDINGWKTTWYLNAPSTELAFRSSPDVKAIMPAEQAEWVKRFAGYKMTLSASSAPGGKAGRGWHKFQLFHAAVGLVTVAWVSFMMLTGQKF